jgi:hypothetical protein
MTDHAVTATLAPMGLKDEELLVMEIGGLFEAAGRSAEVQLRGTDDIETRWIASCSPRVESDGSARVELRLNLRGETVIEVARISVTEPGQEQVLTYPGELPFACALLNGNVANPTVADVEQAKRDLEMKQEDRYRAALVVGNAPRHAYRVVCAVERVLVTRVLRLPGVAIVPAPSGGSGAGEPELLNDVLARLGWPSRIDPAWWAQHSQSNRPWALLVISVQAPDLDAAYDAVRTERERILHLLALNRVAAGRPISTVIEGLDVSEGRIYHEDAPYRGNLFGGVGGGEDQLDLLIHNAAVQADPLLALVTGLLEQAVAELDEDAAYFRYWGVLEVLARARVPAGRIVTLLDGTEWPGSSNTTTYAGPCVYELLKRGPAYTDDLYAEVRGWLGRRNATAHYGRFDATSLAQKARPWFTFAEVTTQGEPGRCLRSLRESARGAVLVELLRVGQPLVT